MSPKDIRRKVIVDGSTVLFAGGSKPKVKNLQLVIQKLKEEGYRPIVVVDASRRHDIDDKPTYERMVSQGIIRQVPAGTPADRWILEYATKHPEYKIVSSDMYADWKKEFPWVGDRNRFIRFMIVGDDVMLDEHESTDIGRVPLIRYHPKEPVKRIPVKIQEKSELRASAENPRPKPRRTARVTRSLRSPFDDLVVGRVTLLAGMILSWILIFGMAVTSVLQVVPSDVWTFLSQLVIFLVASVVGLYLTKLGAERMKEPKTARGVVTYSGVFMLIVAFIIVVARWGSGFQVTDPTFWFRISYVFSLIGMGMYSIRAGRGILKTGGESE